jgi:hypothetical protein
LAQALDILMKIPAQTAFGLLKLPVDREKTGGRFTIQPQDFGQFQHLNHLNPFAGFFPWILGISEGLGQQSARSEKQASDQGPKKEFTKHFP